MKLTWYLSDIWPTQLNWENFVTNNITPIVPEVPSSFHNFIYLNLMYKYSKRNIRYYEKDAFITAFIPIYIQKVTKFYREKQIIDNIYKLSEAELIEVEEALTNVASNPNNEPMDPLAPLPYISNQTYTHIKSNKLDKYLKALDNIPELDFNYFCMGNGNSRALEINDLFTNVQLNAVPVYEED